MRIVRTALATLAISLLAVTFPAQASTYFTGVATRVGANLYEGANGEMINTVACAEAASSTPSTVRIDATSGPVIGSIAFSGGGSCDIAAVYAAYANAPAGIYSAVLTKVDTGYYSDTSVEPFWIVRGDPACPAATATPSFVTLSATGATYVPPGTVLGTITFAPGAGQQACPLIGVFGKVDLTTITAYTLTVSKAGGGTGLVTSDIAVISCGATCAADFGPGTDVTLDAFPSVGSTFAGWSGGGCTGTGACIVTMNDVTNVVATFLVEAPSTFSLAVSKLGAGTGTVTSNPAGIACGATCSANFAASGLVTLTAVADAGSTFSGWAGEGCTGTGTCDVTMDAAKNVAAEFTITTPTTFPLTVTRNGNGSGSVTSNPAGISCGATCTAPFTASATVQLTATADAGSNFAGWSGGGCTGTAGCTVTMDAAKTVIATFVNAAPTTFSLTVAKSGAGSGTVTSNPAGINCGATCSFSFSARTVVALTATPAAGSLFTGWSGACTGSGACNVTMDAVRSVTATFAIQQFALTVAKAGGGAGSVASTPAGIDCGTTCTANFNSGTSVALAATPTAGSVFTGWSGACTGTGACNVTMSAVRNVTATFAIQQFALTVSKSGGGTGLVTSTPSGIDCGATCTANFDTGTSVALGAAPSAGSIFSGWSGACTGTGACNVAMSAVRSVTATFELATTLPRLVNISTRMQVLTGQDVLIGGLIIGGSQPKTVVIRARGPSLIPLGVPNALANPVLQLFSGATQIAVNDNWKEAANQATLAASGYAPSNDFESAIYTTLNPGAYTGIVTGFGGTSGVGIIEVFEVDLPEVPLVNIATRGQVLTGGDVMIAGFIIQGNAPQTVAIRARGPSLAAQGVVGPLQNPMLQLFSGQTQIAINDDWGTAANAAQITSSGFAPADSRESVILVTLAPGAYTAIVTGVGGTTGVAIVEVFAVQ